MSRKFSIITKIDFNKLYYEIEKYIQHSGIFDPYIFMSEDTASDIEKAVQIEFGFNVKDIDSNIKLKGNINNGVKATCFGYKVFINNDLKYGIIEIR